MTMEAHDRAIWRAHSELDQARSMADALVPQFNEVIARLVAAWAQNLVEQAITGKSDVSKSLGKEKLGQMKQRFQTILQSIPTHTQNRLGKDDVWPHRSDLPNAIRPNVVDTYELEQKHAKCLDESLRDLISETGALLIEYGFSSPGDQGDWEQRGSKTPRYRSVIPNHDNTHKPELKKLNEEYNQCLKTFFGAIEKLKDAERTKSSSEAKNLWDQA